jgi:hypothetical protein
VEQAELALLQQFLVLVFITLEGVVDQLTKVILLLLVVVAVVETAEKQIILLGEQPDLPELQILVVVAVADQVADLLEAMADLAY